MLGLHDIGNFAPQKYVFSLFHDKNKVPVIIRIAFSENVLSKVRNVSRWMHQHGYHVERRFGWDTHGLPVEFEIDKTLGIKGPQDVAKMGIAAYNAVSFTTLY